MTNATNAIINATKAIINAANTMTNTTNNTNVIINIFAYLFLCVSYPILSH